jgi:alpha-galactosidase
MTKKIKIAHVEKDFSIGEFDNENWKQAEEVSIKNCWSGEKAKAGRHATAKLLWSDNALYVRFEANQIEPLVVSEKPDLKSKTIGLWERDVCEIFVAPNSKEANKYFEFEIAPTGEWIDLAICQTSEKRETDLEYDSEMKSAAKIEPDKILMAIKIEWKAFGKTPKANDVWKGNLFRCVGGGETRGYLAWQATKTEPPDFHVPEAFGEFEFI